MPDTKKPDAAMTGKRWLRRRANLWEDRGSKAHQFLQIALETGPLTHWPGLRSSPDRLPCHPDPSAFPHEQVSERKFRTGRKPVIPVIDE